MSSDADDFFTIAERLSWLEAQDRERLQRRSLDEGLDPSKLAMQEGLLDAIQLDTIETLQQPREIIPGYEIEDIIGRGGMGVVYRARQVTLDRIVALKTILVSRMADVSAVSRFEQEARTVAQLRHPNIIAAYDFGKHGGRLFFAMELVEGEDLERTIVQRGPLDETAAWGIARQVASGLAHGARHGVVHRDIKPANLLLVEPPEGFDLPEGLPMVKITDFGLAFLTADSETRTRLTAENATVGSPHYMAPEQFEGFDADLRSDIYALGASTYHMLAGKAPFDGMRLPQILARKLAGKIDPISMHRDDLHPGTIALIDRMLSHQPEDRFDDYNSLLAAIDALALPIKGSSWAKLASGAPRSSEHTVVVEGLATGTDSGGSLLTEPHVPATGSQGKKSGLIVWATATLIALTAATLIYLRPWQATTEPVPVATTMTDLGASALLFNGVNTNNWLPVGGNWIAIPQQAVLEGTDGLIGRTLFKAEGGRAAPLEYYRLVVFTERRSEDVAAEVHFGMEAVPGRNGLRYVVRHDKDGITIGYRERDRGEFMALGATVPWSNDSGLVAFVLERQPGGWFVSANERPVGAVRLREPEELPEFRLSSENGTTWFSEITVTELAEATTQLH
ncbi:serine/threonine-protein kinase [Maioricimonas rarisocia]|uniref:serine/threonine-protein kinase n=1 Tax=Maioricimonas rarisocia TaxID=2528026 RepID=UPI0018D271E2|nr:serine/threonine-protein kinase [Maioricimonas rarisocia]